MLLDHFLQVYSQQSLKEGITIAPHARDLLMVYDWPGNVRQVVNELQRLIAYKDSGETITERDLSPMISGSRRPPEGELKALASVKDALLYSAPLPSSTPSGPASPWSNDPPPTPVLSTGQPVQIHYKPGERTLHEVVDEVETQLILGAMRRHSGRRNAVCEELGITRKGLYLKLRRLDGINLAEFE